MKQFLSTLILFIYGIVVTSSAFLLAGLVYIQSMASTRNPWCDEQV